MACSTAGAVVKSRRASQAQAAACSPIRPARSAARVFSVTRSAPGPAAMMPRPAWATPGYRRAPRCTAPATARASRPDRPDGGNVAEHPVEHPLQQVVTVGQIDVQGGGPHIEELADPAQRHRVGSFLPANHPVWYKGSGVIFEITSPNAWRYRSTGGNISGPVFVNPGPLQGKCSAGAATLASRDS